MCTYTQIYIFVIIYCIHTVFLSFELIAFLFVFLYYMLENFKIMCVYIIHSHAAINALHSNIFTIIQDI